MKFTHLITERKTENIIGAIDKELRHVYIFKDSIPQKFDGQTHVRSIVIDGSYRFNISWREVREGFVERGYSVSINDNRLEEPN